MSFFTPENKGLTKSHTSPSGKYRLDVTQYRTGEGTWQYTLGEIYDASNGDLIASVERNYHHFPHLFIEDHPDGPLLVCGFNYQGQTVIALSTGVRVDYLPESAKKGHAFCWASYQYRSDLKILWVEGCYWGGSYEVKVYDFKHPIRNDQANWPEVKIYDASLKETYIDCDWYCVPLLESNGDLTVYASLGSDFDDDNFEGPPELRSWTRYRRNLDRYEHVESWVSPTEVQRRIDDAETERRYLQKQAEYKVTDPLYLAMIHHLKTPEFTSADKYNGWGITHNSWCPFWTGSEQRVGRRLLQSSDLGFTVDIDIAVKTGPVKLDVYVSGKHLESRFYAHSVAGIDAAFADARNRWKLGEINRAVEALQTSDNSNRSEIQLLEREAAQLIQEYEAGPTFPWVA